MKSTQSSLTMSPDLFARSADIARRQRRMLKWLGIVILYVVATSSPVLMAFIQMLGRDTTAALLAAINHPAAAVALYIIGLGVVLVTLVLTLTLQKSCAGRWGCRSIVTVAVLGLAAFGGGALGFLAGLVYFALIIMAIRTATKQLHNAGLKVGLKGVSEKQLARVVVLDEPVSHGAGLLLDSLGQKPARRNSVASPLGEARATPLSVDVARARPALPASHCTGCGRVLAEGAIICTACGFDVRTGRRLQTAFESPHPDVAATPVAAPNAVPAPGSVRLAGALLVALAILESPIIFLWAAAEFPFFGHPGLDAAVGFVLLAIKAALAFGLWTRWRAAYWTARLVVLVLLAVDPVLLVASVVIGFTMSNWRWVCGPFMAPDFVIHLVVTLILLVLLNRRSVQKYFGLICPACGAARGRTARHLFKTVSCRRCGESWEAERGPGEMDAGRLDAVRVHDYGRARQMTLVLAALAALAAAYNTWLAAQSLHSIWGALIFEGVVSPSKAVLLVWLISAGVSLAQSVCLIGAALLAMARWSAARAVAGAAFATWVLGAALYAAVCVALARPSFGAFPGSPEMRARILTYAYSLLMLLLPGLLSFCLWRRLAARGNQQAGDAQEAGELHRHLPDGNRESEPGGPFTRIEGRNAADGSIGAQQHVPPTTDSTQEARRRAQLQINGAVAVGTLSTIITTVVALTGALGLHASLLDAGIVGALTLGVWYRSRICATLFLVSVILERLYTWYALTRAGDTSGSQATAVSLVLFAPALYYGVKGTLAWHAVRKTTPGGTNPPVRVHPYAVLATGRGGSWPVCR
jgi:hypothetical protein